MQHDTSTNHGTEHAYTFSHRADVALHVQTATCSQPSGTEAHTEEQPLPGTRIRAGEAADLFRAIVELAPDATMVVGHDGRIVLVNQQAEALFGYTRQELIGQPVELLIPQRFHATHRRDRARYAAMPRTRSMGADRRLFGRRRDNSEFPVEVSLSPLSAGTWDQTGGAGAVICSVHDITERLRLEAARAAAEASSVELRALQALSDAALSHLDLEELLPALLDRVVALLEADGAAVLLVDATGERLEVRAARGLEAEVAAIVAIPVGQGFTGRIVASRAPLVVDDTSTSDVVIPILREQMRAVAGVPLLVEGRLVGVLHVGARTARHFSERDVSLLRLVADRVALAVDRARLYAAEREARAAAEEQAGQLDRIFEALTDGLLVYDAEGRVVRANTEARRILGMDAVPPGTYTRPLCEHASLYVLRDERGTPVAFEDRPVSRMLRGEMLNGPRTVEMRVVTPDGRDVSLIVGGGALSDQSGRLTGAVCVIHDQTERKQLETSVHESERLFRRTFERVVVGIAHVSPEGRWLRFNQRLCDIVGYSREELGARTFQDITHPDDLAADLAHMRRMLAGERDEYETDKRYIRKDGTPVWVHLTTSLERTPEGAPDYFITVVQDISERKRLEEEREAARARASASEAQASASEAQASASEAQAAASEAQASASEAQAAERAERLHTILETMTDGVFVYDQEGRVVQCNRAYRELIAADRVPGIEALPVAERTRLLDMRDIVTGEPLPRDRIPGVRALRGEVVKELDPDCRIHTLDGRELEVNLSAAPLRDSAGRVMGAVSVVRDVTWLRRLEREREEARAQELAMREVNQRMEQFLATAAHDVRAPLSVVTGFLDLAQRRVQRLGSAAQRESPTLAHQVEAVRSSLEEVDNAAGRLARLVAVLFDTAALRAGKLELRRASCDLAELVWEQVEGQRVAAPERTIHVHEPDASPLLVNADADRIAQVITNYLTNALKYSEMDRPIEVTLDICREAIGAVAESGVARVAVSDAGPGLPQAEQVRVWEPFHRAPGVTVRGGAVGNSMGLGLHVCKAIVEAHGGRVGVESEVGSGSTFWFTLPLADPASAQASEPDGRHA